MSENIEKNVVTNVDHVDHVDEDKKIHAVKVLLGDETFNQAMLKEPPIPFNAIAMQLYLISIVGFCCSTSNGFDSSMFGNLLNNNGFLNFFSVESVGINAGIVSSMVCQLARQFSTLQNSNRITEPNWYGYKP